VAWVQNPLGAVNYHSVLQLRTKTAAAPFLIYQSIHDTSWGFAAGLRGGTVNLFPSLGLINNGRLDRFVLTTTNGFGNNGGLTVYRNSEKHTSSSNTSFNGGVDTDVLIGHLGGGNDSWRGHLGCIAIWNRVLTEAEAMSYNANPWQMFEAPENYEDLEPYASPLLAVGTTPSGTQIDRRVQPQGNARVNGMHTLTRGLKMLLNAGGDYINLANGRRLAVQPGSSGGVLPPRRATVRGLAYDFTTDSNGWRAPTLSSENLSGITEATVLVHFVTNGLIGGADGGSYALFSQGGVMDGYVGYGHGMNFPNYTNRSSLAINWRVNDYGNCNLTTALGSMKPNTVYTAIATFKTNDTVELWLNGAKAVVTAGSSYGATTPETICQNRTLDLSTIGTGVGVYPLGAAATQPAHTLLAASWGRKLADHEIMTLMGNPWLLMSVNPDYGDLDFIQQIQLQLKKALYMNGQGYITETPPSVGAKPLVYLSGRIRQRISQEGVPVTMESGRMRTLRDGETI
jgi:hypothetical protein